MQDLYSKPFSDTKQVSLLIKQRCLVDSVEFNAKEAILEWMEANRD